MKINITKHTIYFALLSFISSVSVAQASLTPQMMKNVTSYIKPGMEHCSVVVGKVALESGLISNLLFYLNKQDPVQKLLTALFPSRTRTLGVYAGQTKFTPEIMAEMINYVQDLRSLSLNNFEKNNESIDKLMNIYLNKMKKKKDKFVKNILGFLKESVLQELTHTSVYPEGTTEQILLAFFCAKANTQQDIWKFLHALKEDIVPADKHSELQSKIDSNYEDLLTKEDLARIADKPHPFTPDDVYAVSKASIFESQMEMIPYIADPGINILTNAYNRTLKLTVEKTQFPNCMETVLRHIINLILYDSNTQTFNLYFLKELRNIRVLKGEDTFNLDQLISFYTHKTVAQAISGAQASHDFWNEVVGDLNANTDPATDQIQYKGYFPQNKNQSSYGIAADLINIVRVLEKLLGLPLSKLSPNASYEQKQTWIKNSLNTVLSQINPAQHYAFDLECPHQTELRYIVGALKITVKDTIQDLFCFTIKTIIGHGAVYDIQILKQKTLEEQEYSTLISQYKHALISQSIDFKNENTLQSLWLADPSANPLMLQKRVHHPLYQLLNHKIEDDGSKFKVFENLINLYPYWQANNGLTNDHKTYLKQILGNIYETLSLTDPYTLKQITLVLMKLSEYPEINQIFPFERVKTLSLNTTFAESPKNLSNFSHLEELSLLVSKGMQTLTLDKEMPKLRKIDLSYSGIQEIIGLKYAPFLEDLNLSHTRDLKTLTFTKYMPKLKNIDLSNSGIQKIKGSKYLPLSLRISLYKNPLFRSNSLKIIEGDQKSINLSEIKEIKSLVFTRKMEKLEKISILNSDINEVQGLDYLSLTAKISLYKYTENRHGRYLKKSCHKLDSMDLIIDSDDQEILDFSNTCGIKSLIFTRKMEILREITLLNSDIRELQGSNYLPSTIKIECLEDPIIKSPTRTEFEDQHDH